MKEFIKAFSGLQRNFGRCDMSKGYTDPSSGKIRFDQNGKDYGWAKRSVTEEDYINHLDGKIAIGIQPCDDDDNAVFGAIDIDPKNYAEFKPEKYLTIIQEKELPLIPVKSKSGGLHIYIFTREKVKATEKTSCCNLSISFNSSCTKSDLKKLIVQSLSRFFYNGIHLYL